jgi:hypothetical protein
LICWFVYLVLAICFYLLWVRVVDPFPEPEGLGRVYWPVLEYLRASLEIGNDYFFLTPRCYYRLPYPEGSAVFAWLFAAMGMQNAVLQNPWIFNIVLIIPVCLSPFFLRERGSGFWLMALAVYFFPFSQICFKQFSLNSHSVVFAFIALLFFRSWLAGKKNSYLFGFWFFMTLALATKHLGVLYLANLAIVYVIWDFYAHKTIDLRAVGAFFAAFLCAMPFYGLLALNFYPAQQVSGHNQSLSFVFFAVAAVLVPSFYCGIALIFSHFSPVKARRKICSGGLFLFLLCFLCVLQLVVRPEEYAAIIPIFLLGALAMGLFGYFCDLSSLRSFMYFFILSSYMNMALIFASNVGRVSSVFFLPLLLLLFQTFLETRQKSLRILMVLLFILISNFTPSLSTMGRFFGSAGFNLYFVMYNTLHNQLGWQKCSLAATKRAMLEKTEKKVFSKEPLFLVETFEPWLSQQMEIYKGNLVLHTPTLRSLSFLLFERGTAAHNAIRNWYEKGDDYIFQLVREAELPILLKPLTRTMPSSIDLYSRVDFPGFRNRDSRYFEALFQNMSAMAWLFNHHIFNCLDSSGLLDSEYDSYDIPEDRPFARLYVLKSLPEKERSPDEPNLKLQELAKEYRKK